MSVALLPPPARTASPAQKGSRTRSRTVSRPKFGPTGRGLHPLPHRASPSTPPHRLTSRGRLAAWALALAALALIGMGLTQALAPSHGGVATYRSVAVLPGQSAWQIAESVNPSIDPRVTISAITAANDLASAGDLRAGQQVLVPVFAER